MELQHQGNSAGYGGQQGSGCQLCGFDGVPLMLQSQRGIEVELQGVSIWSDRYLKAGWVGCELGVSGVPDRVTYAVAVHPLDLHQVGRRAVFGQPMGQCALPCVDNQGQLVQRGAGEHHVKNEVVTDCVMAWVCCPIVVSAGDGRWWLHT